MLQKMANFFEKQFQKPDLTRAFLGAKRPISKLGMGVDGSMRIVVGLNFKFSIIGSGDVAEKCRKNWSISLKSNSKGQILLVFFQGPNHRLPNWEERGFSLIVR